MCSSDLELLARENATGTFRERLEQREQLLELMHGSAEDAFDRSIDVHVSRLRHKLEDDPKSPRLLKTIRGVGYVLTPGDR